MDEHVSCKAAHGEVFQCSWVAEQPIGIELDRGSKGTGLVFAENWRAEPDSTASANDAGYGRDSTFVQSMHSVSERELLDLLDEGNRVAANLATEAHKTRGPVVHDEVWAATIRMKWTPADECRTSATKLDAVSLDDGGNRMLLTDALCIDAFSGGSTDRHCGA